MQHLHSCVQSTLSLIHILYRLFTDRNFAILDKEGKAVGYARSVWAMISIETRKPADLLTLHGGSFTDYVCDKECPICNPGRIKVTEKTPVSEYQTRYCLLYTSIDLE